MWDGSNLCERGMNYVGVELIMWEVNELCRRGVNYVGSE